MADRTANEDFGGTTMSQDDEDVTCWDCGKYECECHPPTKKEIEAMQKLIPMGKCCERTLLSTLEEVENRIGLFLPNDAENVKGFDDGYFEGIRDVKKYLEELKQKVI